MPIFGEAASPYDESVEKVTAETLTSENWDLMLGICDRVTSEGAKGCKQCLISVKKRLNHRDPHVVLFALSLLDCLWNNCGGPFRREVSSKEFISELSYKATNSNRVVGEKTRELVKKWAENECKKDSSLSMIEALYKDLQDGGYTFESSSEGSGGQKKKTVFSNDPNVVHTEEEEADIAKAIALSLNDVKDTTSKSKQSYGASYPSFNNSNSGGSNIPQQQQQQQGNSSRAARQVRALYDFEAVEDNELSFVTGELISLLDDSDPNWWRGSTPRGAGLFPASFVTHDLEPEKPQQQLLPSESQSEALAAQQLAPTARVQIDEDVLLKCIQLLEACDPTGVVPDPPDLQYYEHMSLAQAPLIDGKLAQIDKQHNMLAQIDVAIRDLLANYDGAVQQVQYQMQQQSSTSGAPPPMAYAPPPTPQIGQQIHQLQGALIPPPPPPPMPQAHQQQIHQGGMSGPPMPPQLPIEQQQAGGVYYQQQHH